MNTTPTHDPADLETPTRDLRRDLGGLLLFALAIFLGVSVVMAAQRPDPAAGGTTALVTGLVDLLGAWPVILLSSCLGLLGARLWIAGASERLGRNAFWSLLLALSFALLLGSASGSAGGSFGELTGGNLSGVLSPWAGVPLALAVLAGVVWFAWLRPPEWQPVLSPDEPAPSIYTPTDSEGLTADEAEALLPGQITGRSIRIAPDLSPPYPHDVRREGLIPQGARPLEPRDEPAPRSEPETPAAPALADAAPRVALQPLAEPAGGIAHQAAALAVQPPAQPIAAPLAGSALADLAPAVPRWERPRDLAPAVPDETPEPVPPAPAGFHISAAPVRSAWESEGKAALGDQEEDEEVAVTQPRGDSDEPSDEDGAAEEAEEGLFDGKQVSREEDELDEDVEVDAEEDEDEPESELDEDGSDDDEAPASKNALDAWTDDGDAEVVTAALLDDAPPDAGSRLVASEASAEFEQPSRAAWEQGGLFDDEPVDAYGTPMTLVEELRQANQETSDRLEVTEPQVEIPAPPPGSESTAAATPEPELELQPRPRAAKPKAPKLAKDLVPSAPAAPTADLVPGDDLVFRAGMLFLERGRVAVSMLQRTFDLDFKEATALLDQLQSAGLIGPYLGGQKRDILLTADEWRERRVEASRG